jgi:hypothetical protein
MSAMTELRAFEEQLDRVAALLDAEPDPTPLRAERVSGWSVGEQVDHLLKIVRANLDRLEERRPARRSINLVGRIVLGLGRIPRGVGKCPASLCGSARARAELRSELAAVRARLAQVARATALWSDPRPLVGHPYFGGLTPKQALRFLAVHTDHHLRIVAEIRRAAG